MKKIFFRLFIAILIICNISLSYYPENDNFEQGTTNIVLVNPNVRYLQSIIYLIENKIIDIPNLEITAIIYAQSINHFDDLNIFLEENDYSFIHLQRIGGELTLQNLFCKNPCTESFLKIFRNSDGILFLGGPDYSPAIYNHKTNLLTDITNPYRHYFEISFLFHLLGGSQDKNFQPFLDEKPDYVVYGFCLGMQTMNGATGGTMYQDIPSEIYGLKYVEDVLELDQNALHKNYWCNISGDDNLNWHNFHKLKFIENGFFGDEFDIDFSNPPLVCSSHHQAVNRIGMGLKIEATTLDGKVIEALSHHKYKNVLGVQFHPEISTLYTAESVKYKYAPQDTIMISEHSILKQNNSLQFHYKFWEYFSELFSNEH